MHSHRTISMAPGSRSRRSLVVLLVALVALTASAQGLAQEESARPAASPLRPVDTDSPRGTLQSFLEQTDELAKELRTIIPSARRVHHLRAASETFDLSSTSYGGSWRRQAERVLLLYEILARLELPPLEEVPGPREVAAEGISRWVIPGTRIAIEQKKVGSRAGEFLFSPGSIARLDIDYRRVRHLPYKPGKAGIYETVLATAGSGLERHWEARTRIQGLDLTSPRATLEGLLANVNDAYQVSMEAEAALNASPPTMTNERAREVDAEASHLMRRAALTLDLSKVPSSQVDDVGLQAAIQLKEVLDRVILPPLELVPDAGMVEAQRVPGVPFQWQVPDTELYIVELTDGERAGSFVFSAGTVERIPRMYELLRGLPYRTGITATLDSEYRSAEPSPGFYEAYRSTPGRFVPSATLLGSLVHRLPSSLSIMYRGQTRWQWAGILLGALVAAGVSVIAFRSVSRLSRLLPPAWAAWARVAAPLMSSLVVHRVKVFLDQDLNVTGEVLNVVFVAAIVTELFFFAWAIWRIAIALSESVISVRHDARRGIDANLVRIVARVLGVAAATSVVVARLRDIGVDAVPLFAGLGVGGLASALALKPTLENLVGGFVLFLSRPVVVGDHCSFGKFEGVVEEIGLRSTRIRADDRALISVPNAKFVDLELVNWARCDRMLIETELRVPNSTRPKDLRELLERLRGLLRSDPRIHHETARVRLSGYGEHAFSVSVRAYALTSDLDEFHGIREGVFLQINDLLHEPATGSAAPSGPGQVESSAGPEPA